MFKCLLLLWMYQVLLSVREGRTRGLVSNCPKGDSGWMLGGISSQKGDETLEWPLQADSAVTVPGIV